MNAVVEEWIRKSEGDFLTASREFIAEPPNYDAACYHAQQCIEKLMKAMLIAHSIQPPFTHDLAVLSQMLVAADARWSWALTDLRLLSRAAVVFRYPGESAGPDEARAALGVCSQVRARLLLLIGTCE